MNGMCEKCGKRPAVVHITEMLDGITYERDLCEECSDVRAMPAIIPLQWRCRCGRTVEWRYEAELCGHGAEHYSPAGEMQQEVAVCECGMHYVARFPVWKCDVCGKTSLFPPKMGGGKGFLRSYLYGDGHMAKIEIEGVSGGDAYGK